MSFLDSAKKLLSGRLWLTAIAGVSFLLFAITVCQILYVKKDIITVSETTGIINTLLLVISNIFTFYFTKERNEDKQKTIKEQLEEKINEDNSKTENSK